MVKSGSSKSSKVVKSTSSKSTPDVDKSTNAKTTSDDEQSTIILCLDDENSVVHSDDDEEVIEIVNSARDAVYDDDVARTFIVRALGEVEEKTIQTKSGGTKEEVVLNVDITDASGNDKVIIVWGPPAVHVREFFEYVEYITTFVKYFIM